MHPSSFRNPLIRWIDSRLPVFTLLHREYVAFEMPRNVNVFWAFGAIGLVLLVLLMASGVFLAMHYIPNTAGAFASVEHIMRDVNYGWLLRYLHANAGSFFFLAVYIHLFRALYYGSHRGPRELVWLLGVLIYFVMMATGFLGYVLPWGQMSFWAATVITNLFSALPVIGDPVVTWLWGGFAVDSPTLTRFYALHYLMPFVLLALVLLHVWAVHVCGANNPLGVERTNPKDRVPFYPYIVIKDLVAVALFLLIAAAFLFFMPNALGHPDNYIPADPLVTPAHIEPEWYFLPLYAILRAVPDKLGGAVAMVGAVLVLFPLPWLDSSKVRSMVFKPLSRLCFWLFVADCVLLGVCGANPPEGGWVLAARAGTLGYFAYFLVIIPLLARFETVRREEVA